MSKKFKLIVEVTADEAAILSLAEDNTKLGLAGPVSLEDVQKLAAELKSQLVPPPELALNMEIMVRAEEVQDELRMGQILN